METDGNVEKQKTVFPHCLAKPCWVSHRFHRPGGDEPKNQNRTFSFATDMGKSTVRSLYLVKAMSDVIGQIRPRQHLGFKVAAIQTYADNLNQVILLARAKGIEPVLLTWPTRVSVDIDRLRTVEIIPKTGINFDVWFDFYQRYQNELTAVARRQGVRTIDLAQAFATKHNPGLFYDEIHLSDAGNFEAAQIIYRDLTNAAN